jgi:hypothetical protein
MKMTDDNKVTVLISALAERYESLRAIRSRVQDIALWLLGILLAASAWLIAGTVVPTLAQKTIYTIAVAAAFIAVRLVYLEDLHSGFKGQLRTVARLEEALGMFQVSMFDASSDSVYPKEWRDAGTKNGKGRFFKRSFLLIYVGVAVLLVAVWFKGIWF